MAIRVRYFEDAKPEHYVEGPFVMVDLLGSWRIEMRNDNAICSTVPKGDYWDWAQEATGTGTLKGREDLIESCVDALNKRYRHQALDELTALSQELGLYTELEDL